MIGWLFVEASSVVKPNIKKIFFKDKTFNVFNEVYEPAEDTFLIAENLKVNASDEVLDLGTGCGILSILSAQKAKTVVAVDVNPEAVRCTRLNAKENGVSDKVEVVRGDLFGPLKKGSLFDVVLFNAPYLPTEREKPSSWIDYAWSGGKKGRELIDRFIKHVFRHLKHEGRILLVQSTLSDVNETLEKFMKQGFEATIIAEKKVAFETITLIQAEKKHDKMNQIGLKP
jgi:release factor glutamine methyltransferase